MKQGVGWYDGKSSTVSKKIQIPGWVSGFFDLPGKSKGRYGLHSHFPIYQSVQLFLQFSANMLQPAGYTSASLLPVSSC